MTLSYISIYAFRVFCKDLILITIFLQQRAEHDSTGRREGNEDAWRASDQRRGTPGVDYLTYILVKVLLVIFGEGSRAHVAAVCTSYTLSFELKESILNFIFSCAFHRSTSHRPRYIPTEPTCAMLTRLGTRRPHVGWHIVLQHHNSLQRCSLS